MRVAEVVAERSLCARARVGAVIISYDQVIVATGRNGPPRGFAHYEKACTEWCPRTESFSWSPTEARMAYGTDDLLFESGKTFLRSQSGAVHELVTDDDWLKHGFQKVFTGEKDYSDCPSLHAEVNALLTSDRSARTGGTIYVTGELCYACAKMIANSGLGCVVVLRNDLDYLARNSEAGYTLLRNLDIAVIRYERT